MIQNWSTTNKILRIYPNVYSVANCQVNVFGNCVYILQRGQWVIKIESLKHKTQSHTIPDGFDHCWTWPQLWRSWNDLVLTSTNTLRPRQDGRQFADDIFICIFSNENVLNFHSNLTEICSRESSWQKLAMVQVIAWCQTCNEWLPESKLTKIHNTISFHQATIQLTYCGLATPLGDICLGQYCLRQWLVAWWHQAIAWTNVDL